MNWNNWHDDQFLYGLLNGVYGSSLMTSAALVACYLLLPAHRRLVQLFTGLISLAGLVLILNYGAFTEAPLLGWTILGCLVLSGLRFFLWTGRSPSRSLEAVPSGSKRLRIPARFASWLIRDYFRADPRGSYWIDWTRVRYKQPVQRSAIERQELLSDAFEACVLGAGLWRRVVFPLLDRLILFHAWLPGYWKRELKSSALPDPFARSVLESEIAATEFAMHDAFAGPSFEAYLERAVNPEVLEASQKKAGQYGRKYCRLIEAKIEADIFSQQPSEQPAAMEQAATDYFELWRFRKTYSHLWHWCIHKTGQESSSVGNPAALNAANNTDESWVNDESLQMLELNTLDEDDSSNSQSESESDETDLVFAGFDEEDEHASHSPISKNKKPTSAVASHHDGEVFNQDSINDEAETNTEFASSESIPNESSDEATGLATELAQQEMAEDLVSSCRLLEDYLQFSPTGDLATDVRSVERLLDKPRLLPAAVRLLATYCLRNDFVGHGIESGKIKLLTKLRERFRDVPTNDKHLVRVRSMFYDMYFDILAERRAYGVLRELFSNRTPQSAHQWHLLGNALTHTALQIRKSSSLRDDRLRDAAAAFFRSQTRAFWTQRYAGLLLETDSALDTMKLFTRFPVETNFQGQASQASIPTQKSTSTLQKPIAKPKTAPDLKQQTSSKKKLPAQPEIQKSSKTENKKSSKQWILQLRKPERKAKQLSLVEFNNIEGMPIQIQEKQQSLILKVIGDPRSVRVNESPLIVRTRKLQSGDQILIKTYLFEVMEA